VFAYESETFTSHNGQRLYLVCSYEHFWHYYRYDLIRLMQLHCCCQYYSLTGIYDNESARRRVMYQLVFALSVAILNHFSALITGCTVSVQYDLVIFEHVNVKVV
jgi:hypothetical protein